MKWLRVVFSEFHDLEAMAVITMAACEEMPSSRSEIMSPLFIFCIDNDSKPEVKTGWTEPVYKNMHVAQHLTAHSGLIYLEPNEAKQQPRLKNHSGHMECPICHTTVGVFGLSYLHKTLIPSDWVPVLAWINWLIKCSFLPEGLFIAPPAKESE